MILRATPSNCGNLPRQALHTSLQWGQEFGSSSVINSLRREVIHCDGIFEKRIIPGHNRDPAFGHEIALAIRLGIKADGGAFRDMHVAIENGSTDVTMAAYAHMREPDAVFYFRVGVDAHIRREHRLLHQAAGNNASCGDD